MKMLACPEDGFSAKGEDEKEVMDKMWDHLKMSHPDDYQKMMSLDENGRDKFMTEHKVMITDV
jgi:predicted small metal-binding protein